MYKFNILGLYTFFPLFLDRIFFACHFFCLSSKKISAGSRSKFPVARVVTGFFAGPEVMGQCAN